MQATEHRCGRMYTVCMYAFNVIGVCTMRVQTYIKSNFKSQLRCRAATHYFQHVRLSSTNVNLFSPRYSPFNSFQFVQICAPMALFFLDSRKKLMPVAIQLFPDENTVRKSFCKIEKESLEVVERTSHKESSLQYDRGQRALY